MKISNKDTTFFYFSLTKDEELKRRSTILSPKIGEKKDIMG